MRILLDENMPYNLVKALRAEGHDVESVHTLGIAGIKNGELYKVIKNEYDLLFTKDAGFNDWAKKIKGTFRAKYVLVTLPQKSQDLFVKDFIAKFCKVDWSKHVHGNAWPKEIKQPLFLKQPDSKKIQEKEVLDDFREFKKSRRKQ